MPSDFGAGCATVVGGGVAGGSCGAGSVAGFVPPPPQDTPNISAAMPRAFMLGIVTLEVSATHGERASFVAVHADVKRATRRRRVRDRLVSRRRIAAHQVRAGR